MATHSSIPAWENFIDGGAWWTTVHRVAKNLALLKQLTTPHAHASANAVQNPTASQPGLYFSLGDLQVAYVINSVEQTRLQSPVL